MKLRIFEIAILNTKWKDLSKSRKNLCTKNFTCTKKFYVDKIAALKSIKNLLPEKCKENM